MAEQGFRLMINTFEDLFAYSTAHIRKLIVPVSNRESLENIFAKLAGIELFFLKFLMWICCLF